MKTMKSLLFIFMLSVTTTIYAASATEPIKDPLSREISQMLSDSFFFIEEDFTVKVLFTVTESKIIQIRSISSENEMVNEFLYNKLHGQQLKGSTWYPEKLYELPVKVQARR